MDNTAFELVLVRPTIAENVGMILRSMKAFGFQKLTLIDPVFEWNEDGPAWKTACGARDLLPGVTLRSSLEETVAHCHRVAGFSRRPHGFVRPQLDLAAWIQDLRQETFAETTALVFGSEDQGLSNEDKRLCDTIVSIPLRAETLSLNLAHAVTVVLYELTRSDDIGIPKSIQKENMPIEHQDIQRVLVNLTSLLDKTAFFKEGRRWYQEEILRALIQRLHLTRQEYNTVMGILNALKNPHDGD